MSRAENGRRAQMRVLRVVQGGAVCYPFSAALVARRSCLAHLPSAGHLDRRCRTAMSQQSCVPYRVQQVCERCAGEGQLKVSAKKKQKLHRLQKCHACCGSGLLYRPTASDEQRRQFSEEERVAIVGGGIGGLALALALSHRSIPFVLYERDAHLLQRSQGYGLTLQQGAAALKSLGISLRHAIHSKRHLVHTADGTLLGQWGMSVWGPKQQRTAHTPPHTTTTTATTARHNAHLPRQELRKIIYHDLISHIHATGTISHQDGHDDKDSGDDSNDIAQIKWGHKLLRYDDLGDKVRLTLQREGTDTVLHQDAKLLVGADGIRSMVRHHKFGDSLRYLHCIVILGIVATTTTPPSHPLTDGETVFQTADGTTRLYVMPFSTPTPDATTHPHHNTTTSNVTAGETMWQLSFPMEEKDAIRLSRKGNAALKQEAMARCGKWHDPIPHLLRTTPEHLISGYPVYDRELLHPDPFRSGTPPRDGCSGDSHSRVTLIGDAAHPMSPFKGQGANQALLDAVSLARTLYRVYRPGKEGCTLSGALVDFESTMLMRSRDKVKASADAARFLHTDVAIMEGNCTRVAAFHKSTTT